MKLINRNSIHMALASQRQQIYQSLGFSTKLLHTYTVQVTPPQDNPVNCSCWIWPLFCL